ncbi:MAG TPA: phosphatidylglycerol lysyltransferase domain-containing protein, partial [Actinoplanes sp.]|nr:phosphatidylglycerol lysyltransferase domain-containing protein [Actinoplanes sp.]
MRQQTGAAPEVPWRSRPPLSRNAVARLVQFAGAFDALTAILPPRHRPMALLIELVPAAGVLSARAATGVVGVLLIYLGAGLRRGKRRAWQVAVGLAALSVVLHLFKGLDLDATLVSVGLLAMLIAVRNQFHAVADPRNRWRALVALIGFGLAGWVLGFLEIAFRDNRLIGRPTVWQWAQEALYGLVGVSGPLHFASPFGAQAVSLTTGSFGMLAAGAAAVLLLRPGSRRPERTAEEDRRLRELLDKYGDADSLSYFALRTDKSLMWAPSGKAAVAYRVINGVSLAAGDPLGLQSAWPEAITEWLADCSRHGWTPAVLACGNTAGKAYRKHGLDVIELGDEAIVDVDAFSLQGRPMRAVRQAVNRVQRAGYACQVVRQKDVPHEVLAEATHAAEAFREGHTERGFSMALSRFGDPSDAECLLVLCRDGEGRLRGLLQFVPWGSDGLSLDLMRGDRDAENGLTELMVVSAIEAAPKLGVRRISLNFAVLRSVFARAEELGAGPVLRIWHRLLRAVSRLWQIESL